MSIETAPAPAEPPARLSLTTTAARNLATVTKTRPQMRGISPRWLLRRLPWVHVGSGTYRVNRRLTYTVGRGRVSFVQTGTEVRVIPPSLREIPLLRDFPDEALLTELAARFAQRRFAAGEVLVRAGRRVDEVLLIAHGKVAKIGTGKYGEPTTLGMLAGGDHLGDQAWARPETDWDHTIRASTACTVLAIPQPAFQQLVDRSPALRDQIQRYLVRAGRPTNNKGEAAIRLAAGHTGEPTLPGTYVDYEPAPREYELSAAQTVLRVHSRVADLYNGPMDQVEEQLRLTVQALRERQEYELVNNPEFGLLHNTDYDQRITTRSGPPTPADLDALLTMRRSTRLFLAHPRAIAAFGRECNSRGIYPDVVDVDGRPMYGWRNVPIFPCDKIPVVGGHTSAILAMRTGEDDQGVVGLHQTGIPDEYEPGLSVRFTGLDDRGVISYLVSAYYSAAVLVPNAIGVLEGVEISRPNGAAGNR